MANMNIANLLIISNNFFKFKMGVWLLAFSDWIL